VRAASSHLTDLLSLRRENTRKRLVSEAAAVAARDGANQRSRRRHVPEGERWRRGWRRRRQRASRVWKEAAWVVIYGLGLLGFRPRQKFGPD